MGIVPEDVSTKSAEELRNLYLLVRWMQRQTRLQCYTMPALRSMVCSPTHAPRLNNPFLSKGHGLSTQSPSHGGHSGMGAHGGPGPSGLVGPSGLLGAHMQTANGVDAAVARLRARPTSPTWMRTSSETRAADALARAAAAGDARDTRPRPKTVFLSPDSPALDMGTSPSSARIQSGITSCVDPQEGTGVGAGETGGEDVPKRNSSDPHVFDYCYLTDHNDRITVVYFNTDLNLFATGIYALLHCPC